MTLLSEDEAFVTQRHLIDDVDIPRVTAEYKTRWGEEFTKTERTIRSYQRRALQKIMRFEQNKPTLPICPLNNAFHCSEHILSLE